MGTHFNRWVTLQDDVEQVRLDFIRTDLQVCFTLTSVAETHCDSGNREHAARTIAAIEKGYSTLVRFLAQAKGLTPEVERNCGPNCDGTGRCPTCSDTGIITLGLSDS